MIRRNFTLVEILTVIAIIAILMGLLLPVMSTAQRKGKENKARAAIQSIKFAIEQYENDYGILPKFISGTETPIKDMVFNETIAKSQETNPSKTDSYSSKTYDEFMEVLTLANKDTGAAVTNENTKKIRYLEAPANKVRDIKNAEGYFILDPWGRRYGIVIDNNYDGMLGNDDKTIDGVSTKAFKAGDTGSNGGYVAVRAKVAVFSYGALKENAADDKTYHINSWK